MSEITCWNRQKWAVFRSVGTVGDHSCAIQDQLECYWHLGCRSLKVLGSSSQENQNLQLVRTMSTV
jgi:hypothetical protein